MNDDFLHRIRKVPSPEFLQNLKERLDRQPLPPSPPRRSSFLRGLLVGGVLASTALAIAAVSLDSTPYSLPVLVKASTDFLARLTPGARDPDTHNEPDHHGVLPLGPAWLANRVQPGQRPVPVRAASAALDARHQTSGDAATAGPSQTSGSAGGAPGALAPLTFSTSQTLTIIASPEVLPFAKSAAAHIKLDGVGIVKTKPLGSEPPPFGVCLSDAHDAPEVVAVSRRITPDELRSCKPSRNSIIELKIGYQAVVLARAKLYDGFPTLSRRDLYKVLSSRLPNGSSGTLIDNPIATWYQLDSELPNELIQVFGPAPTSDPGRLAQDLLLEPGCEAANPGIAALRDRYAPDYSSSIKYSEMCRKFRGDGVYIASTSVTGFTASGDLMMANPTAIGVFGVREFALGEKNRLTAIAIDGLYPTAANIANGTYPASRTLYLYANKHNVEFSQLFSVVVRYMSPQKSWYNDPGQWAFVPLDDAERTSTLATADSLTESQF